MTAMRDAAGRRKAERQFERAARVRERRRRLLEHRLRAAERHVCNPTGAALEEHLGLRLYDLDVLRADAAHDLGVDPRQGLAHRPGLDVHRGVVSDHDPAGLGLPPVVVERYPERSRSGMSRAGAASSLKVGRHRRPRRTSRRS
jgi:hypothetical protein